MKVGVDSNTLIDFVNVIRPGYDPESAPNSCELISLLRIFFYGGYAFCVTPTVQIEISAAKDLLKKKEQVDFCSFLTEDGPWNLDDNDLAARTSELLDFHKGRNDCRIIAEAELGALDVLLTRDGKLLKKLMAKTNGLKISLPSIFWASLRIPEGSKLQTSPNPSNPLSGKKWWQH